MTLAEMITLLKVEVKGLTSYLEADDDYTNACNEAARETGWAFPVSGDFKIFWTKQRAKRHVFFYLASESAHKFKFKQINLQHRFDHYWILIKGMDKDFEAIQAERPDQFAGVDTFKLFGTKVDAGFQYEPQTGIDTTYGANNEVMNRPNDTD